LSFYRELLEQDRIYEGLDAPRVSIPRLMNDLAKLQAMTPEQRAESKAKLDALFASFEDDWRAKGWIS